MKKLFLVFILLFSLSAFTQTGEPNIVNEVTCRVELDWAGTYFGWCPEGAVATGVRVNHHDPRFMPQVLTECKRIRIVCDNE